MIIAWGLTYLISDFGLFDSDLNTPFQSLINDLSHLRYSLLIILFPIGFISLLFDSFNNDSDEKSKIKKKNEQRQAEFKKKLMLYHEMRYCESCHLLYNTVRDCCQPAHQNGFEIMLRLAIQ